MYTECQWLSPCPNILRRNRLTYSCASNLTTSMGALLKLRLHFGPFATALRVQGTPTASNGHIHLMAV